MAETLTVVVPLAIGIGAAEFKVEPARVELVPNSKIDVAGTPFEFTKPQIVAEEAVILPESSVTREGKEPANDAPAINGDRTSPA